MICANRHSPRHDGLDIKSYYLPLSHGTRRDLCRGCVSALRSLGMDWQDERRSGRLERRGIPHIVPRSAAMVADHDWRQGR